MSLLAPKCFFPTDSLEFLPLICSSEVTQGFEMHLYGDFGLSTSVISSLLCSLSFISSHLENLKNTASQKEWTLLLEFELCNCLWTSALRKKTNKQKKLVSAIWLHFLWAGSFPVSGFFSSLHYHQTIFSLVYNFYLWKN